jgi:hypothetical protein
MQIVIAACVVPLLVALLLAGLFVGATIIFGRPD